MFRTTTFRILAIIIFIIITIIIILRGDTAAQHVPDHGRDVIFRAEGLKQTQQPGSAFAKTPPLAAHTTKK